MHKTHLLGGAAAIVIVASLSSIATPAQAEDCILSINDNDTANGRAGANSGGADFSLACGTNANATGEGATAIGAQSEATNVQATQSASLHWRQGSPALQLAKVLRR